MESTRNSGFLLHKVGAMMETISDKVLFEEFGIGFSQFKILFALEHRRNGIPQKEIALFLGQTEASISRQIKLLVSAKLVAVTPDERDKKKHIVTLTERGEETAGMAFDKLNLHYQPILGSLSPHDQKQLGELLYRVHSALEQSCR